MILNLLILDQTILRQLTNHFACWHFRDYFSLLLVEFVLYLNGLQCGSSPAETNDQTAAYIIWRLESQCLCFKSKRRTYLPVDLILIWHLVIKSFISNCLFFSEICWWYIIYQQTKFSCIASTNSCQDSENIIMWSNLFSMIYNFSRHICFSKCLANCILRRYYYLWSVNQRS